MSGDQRRLYMDSNEFCGGGAANRDLQDGLCSGARSMLASVSFTTVSERNRSVALRLYLWVVCGTPAKILMSHRSIDDNWIETKVDGPDRASWQVVQLGEILHSGELEVSDPSGLQAYQAAVAWTEKHCPGVTFNWRHHLTPRMKVATP